MFRHPSLQTDGQLNCLETIEIDCIAQEIADELGFDYVPEYGSDPARVAEAFRLAIEKREREEAHG